MNPLDLVGDGAEAVLEYHDADFEVVKPGGFVRCAVTGARIPLQELRYWNVDAQEAYADAASALEGFRRASGKEDAS
ncbi:MAG: DUF2093 domain-containing protein [Parvularculaceae bacterium]